MTFLSDKSNIQVVDEPVYKSELVGGSPVSTAGGTPNRYSKFTAPTVIGDGLLSDDGVTITTYADIVPDIDNTRSLGSPALGYSNLYLASNINYASNLLFKSGGVQKLSLDTNGFILFNNNQGLDVVGTGGVDVLNIGTANADTINIGWSGANVNIMGNTFYENVTQLQVKDKLFTVNKGGAVASGASAGFEIEEGGIITGQFSTSGTRDGWYFLAPAIASSATLSLANLLANRTYTLPDASGTLALTSDITSDWQLDGNTNGAVKYIGTNDANDFPIRTNGVEVARFTSNGRFGVGIVVPLASVHFFGSLNSINQRLEPVAGVTEDVLGATITTVNVATVTTLQSITLAVGDVVLIEARVTAKKTAGAGVGTIGDGNGYIRTVKAKNVAGVVTIGTIQASFTSEDIGAFDATFDVSGATVRVRVNGAVNDTVIWNTITRVEKVT